MICRADNELFISKILEMKPKDIVKLMREEDQKYLLRKKQQILENMPLHLKPVQKIKPNNNLTLLKSVINSTLQQQKLNSAVQRQFPSNFDANKTTNVWENKLNYRQNRQGEKQNKAYLPNTFSQPFQFKTGISGQFDRFLGSLLPNQQINDDKLIKFEENNVNKPLDEKIIFKTQNQKEISFNQIPKQNNIPQMINQQARLNFANDQISKNVMKNFLQPQKFSPFVPNQHNFFDIHTNKKSVPLNYLSPEVHSMNMLQYAHDQKKQNTFNDGYSFPNTVMSGSGSGNGIMKTGYQMRQNPFKKTFSNFGPRYDDNYQIQHRNKQNMGQNNIGNYAELRYHQKMQHEVIPEVNQEMKLGSYIIEKAKSKQSFRENIKDVLRYTLEDKRFPHTNIQKLSNTNLGNQEYLNTRGVSSNKANKKQKLMQNPFMRRPGSTYKY